MATRATPDDPTRRETGTSASSASTAPSVPDVPGPRARGLGARDLAYVATFAALIVVLGLPGAIFAFGSGVPITLQTFGVMLAGLILGGRRGALACLLVVALCALGLPVLAGGRGGLGVFAGPTVGFLLGWVPGAAVTGWLAARRAPGFSVPWGTAGALLGGIGVVHALGVLVLAWRAHLAPSAALTADLVFVPGDLVKAALAVVVAAAVHRAVPGLLPVRGARP